MKCAEFEWGTLVGGDVILICSFCLDTKRTKKVKRKKCCLTHSPGAPAFFSGWRGGLIVVWGCDCVIRMRGIYLLIFLTTHDCGVLFKILN